MTIEKLKKIIHKYFYIDRGYQYIINQDRCDHFIEVVGKNQPPPPLFSPSFLPACRVINGKLIYVYSYLDLEYAVHLFKVFTNNCVDYTLFTMDVTKPNIPCVSNNDYYAVDLEFFISHKVKI